MYFKKILYVKSFLRDMAEKLQVAVRQRRQPLIMRCCLMGNMTAKGIVQRNGIGFLKRPLYLSKPVDKYINPFGS